MTTASRAPFATLAVPWYIGDREPAFSVAGVPGIDADPRGDSAMERMVSLFDRVADWVAGHLPAALQAPDCMAPLAAIAGLQRAGLEPQLVWIDAHGDFNTWETTPSGYLGGMPLAMLVGRGDQALIEGLRIAPLDESRVVLGGARDLDPGEVVALDGSGVRRLSVDGLAELTLPDRPLHVHLDVDVVDPAGLPGLLYPAPGGPGVAPVVAALRHLGALSQLASVSVAHTYDQRGAGVAESRRVSAELAAALVQPR